MTAHGEYEIDTCVITTNSTGDQLDGPCGHCRQALREFSPPNVNDLRIILINKDGKEVTTSIGKLLPYSFGPDSLGIEKPNQKKKKMVEEGNKQEDAVTAAPVAAVEPVKLNG